MSELPESNRPMVPSPADGSDPAAFDQAASDPAASSPAASDPVASDAGAAEAASASPSMADVDREVSEAMAGMDAADIADLCGGDVPSDDRPEPGAELIGTVVGFSDEDVFLEFGGKTQGLLPRSQFGKKEPIAKGRRVDVVADKYDDDSGLLIVNRKGVLARATWLNLAVGQPVEGRVTGLIKGGLEVDLHGIRAFMPTSQVGTTPMKDISVLLNQVIRCEVIELDRRGKNVLISRRKVVEQELKEARKKLEAELEVGQTRRGVVKNITDFGAFVDLGGIEGLAHIRDLSWGTVDKVSDVLTTGQEVEVKILKLDRERGRISLGLKQSQPDPWDHAIDRFPVETKLKVRIVRVADFGAFAELEPGIEGLIPISEMSWTRVRTVGDVVSVGDMVDAVVIRVEAEKRRLALSIKQAQADPWHGVLESFAAQSLATGRVTRLADFGAFVEIATGVEGLIHISELSDRRVGSCSEVVQEGQEVEVRVLGVDEENRRISLSLKQAKAPLSTAAEVSGPAEQPKARKKRKKPLRGGLSSHFNW